MRKYSIVLGLGFGDEGKGRTVADICSEPNVKDIVVRFSGGHQAGHTVIYKRRKHVHSSFGSGTLLGVPTYLTEHVVMSPIHMYNEWTYLNKLGIEPEVYLHPFTKIATPMDTFSNQNDSKQLKDGSCGLGVGNTIQREEDGYFLLAVDTIHPDLLEAKFRNIYNYYVKRNFRTMPRVEEMFETFAHNLSVMQCKVIKDIVGYKYLQQFEKVVFEGSQGIMLDQKFGLFPNVTRSNTTSINAIEVIKQIKERGDFVESYYVTRSYQTRHGNGWMSHEQPLKLINNNDEINVNNPYQGKFRLGDLDYNLLYYAYKIDRQYNISTINNLVVTCVDQLFSKPPDLKLIDFGFNNIYYSVSSDNDAGFLKAK